MTSLGFLKANSSKPARQRPFHFLTVGWKSPPTCSFSLEEKKPAPTLFQELVFQQDAAPLKARPEVLQRGQTDRSENLISQQYFHEIFSFDNIARHPNDESPS